MSCAVCGAWMWLGPHWRLFLFAVFTEMREDQQKWPYMVDDHMRSDKWNKSETGKSCKFTFVWGWGMLVAQSWAKKSDQPSCRVSTAHKVRGWWIVGGTRSTAVVGKLAPSSTSLPPPWHYYQGRLQSFPTKPLPMHHHNFHSTHPSANFRQIGQYLIFLPYPLEMKYFAFIHSQSIYNLKLTWTCLDFFCGSFNPLLRISLDNTRLVIILTGRVVITLFLPWHYCRPNHKAEQPPNINWNMESICYDHHCLY